MSIENTPLVSVALIVYNEERYISQVLESLVNQTYANLEICISDNASIDGTWEIIETYEKRYANIKANRNPENLGMIANMICCVSMTRGKYIMMAAADDLYDRLFVEELLPLFEWRLKVIGVMSNVEERDLDTNSKIGEINFDKKFNKLSKISQSKKVLTANQKKRVEKHNLLIRGIFDSSFLKNIIASSPDFVNYGERTLPSLASLSGGMLCLDKSLFIRRKRQGEEKFSVRYPDDPYVKNGQEYHSSFLCLFFIYSKIIWQSSTVPVKYKLLSPIILSSFLTRAITEPLVRHIKTPITKRLSREFKDKVKSFLGLTCS